MHIYSACQYKNTVVALKGAIVCKGIEDAENCKDICTKRCQRWNFKNSAKANKRVCSLLSIKFSVVLMSKRTANVRKFPTIWHASARPLPAQQYSPSQTQTLGQIINLTKCLGQDILMLIYFHN